jgi:folate-binding protein YgfZ
MLLSDAAHHARLSLRGPDRVRLLHGMVTADIEHLKEGQGTRAAMLSVKGRLLADIVVYALPDELLLSLDAALDEKVRALLDKHIVMDDVEVVARPELAELGVFGDDAPAALAGVLPVDAGTLGALPSHAHVLAGELRVARDPSLGGLGFRLLGTKEAIAAVAGTLPGDALTPEVEERMRVVAGTAKYGAELDEDRLVVEANLDDAISFDKGCYLGQEVVVRATSRGRVNRRLMGLVLDGDGPAAPRTKLASAAALGYVHRAAEEAREPLALDGGGRRALPVSLPFNAEEVAAARARLRG